MKFILLWGILSLGASSGFPNDQNRIKNDQNARAHELEDAMFGSDDVISKQPECPLSVHLKWMSSLQSSVYSTPILHQFFSDKTKQLIIPTFANSIELLDESGEKPPGWPITFETSSFHTSPLLHDVDNDGKEEILVVTGNGQIIWIEVGDFGEYLSDYELLVPKLKVRKDWHDGMDDQKLDAEHLQGLTSFHHEDVASAQEPNRNKGGLRGKQADKIGYSQVQRKTDEQPQDATPTSAVRTGNHEKSALLTSELDGIAQKLLENLRNELPEEALESFSLFENVSNKNAKKVPLQSEDKKFIFVDAHVIATPTIGDVDGDGGEELIIAASYFFDKNEYQYPQGDEKVDPDPSSYVAGGVVCYDLLNKKWSWQTHLDLTTDRSKFRAYIYSSPTIADLNGDLNAEIIVGTSLGFLYVLNGADGQVVAPFPIQTGEIQGQIAVADVIPEESGDLEMIFGDSLGNVIVVGMDAKIRWSVSTSGMIAQAPSIGDIDGDGILDVVVGTDKGEIWAFRGTDGKVLANFPVKAELNGKIVAPITLTRLNQEETHMGMHVVAPSFDGHVYIVEGKSGCVNKIDISEHIYAMVLADDVTGNGKTDLLIATMNGNLYCYETDALFHPLDAVSSQTLGKNGFTAQRDHMGIYALPINQKHRQVLGKWIKVEFVLVDKRKKINNRAREYRVKIRQGGIIRFNKTYTEEGIYVAYISLDSPQKTTLTISMTNEHQQYFQDTFSVSYNTNFQQTLKWLLFTPFAIMSGLLLFTGGLKTPLPVHL